MRESKKLIWILVVIGMSACGGDGPDPPIVTNDYVALGQGTDVFGTYASSDNIKSTVLDVAALEADGMLEIDKNIEESSFSTVSGTTISEYAKSFGSSVGLSGSYKFFSASIKTNFSSRHYESEQYSFATTKENVHKQS